MAAPPVPWWKTDLGTPEIDSLAAAIRGRRVNYGPLCRELESQLAQHLGVPHVALTTSGSVALLLTFLTCGLRAGDEVILPASAFIAAAHAAVLLGARLRLVDVLPDTQILDVRQVEAAITDATRIIVAVHMNGHACDMPALNAIAARRGLTVIEDAAQAFCSRNSQGYLGTQSAAGAFSMGITKLITTGEGGFVAAPNEETHARLVKLRNHGVDNIADNVFDGFGGNFRLTDLQAAVGLAQYQQLPERIRRLRRVHGLYKEQLADMPHVRLVEPADADALPLWIQVLCDDRRTLVAELTARGIETRPFHPCLADSPHLHAGGHFPNAHSVAARGLTLPSGPDQTEENLERTVEALRTFTGRLVKQH